MSESQRSSRPSSQASNFSGKARRRGPPLSNEAIETFRNKVKAAAYTGTGGRQLDVIFGRFDKDGSGHLEDHELRSALRRTLRIPPTVISDQEISSLCGMLDTDNSGSVGINELINFVG